MALQPAAVLLPLERHPAHRALVPPNTAAVLPPVSRQSWLSSLIQNEACGCVVWGQVEVSAQAVDMAPAVVTTPVAPLTAHLPRPFRA